jgi:hypothetical protein
LPSHPYGGGTLQSYHCYVAAGVPKTQVPLGVYGAQVRTLWNQVLLAEYRCRSDWRTHQVQDRRAGRVYPTRCVPPQGTLLPFHPQEFLVRDRPQAGRYPARTPFPPQQSLLFERVRSASGRRHSPHL